MGKNRYVIEFIGMGSKKYGGFERYIVEEARQLKSLGYTLVVVFDRNPIKTQYLNDLEIFGVKIEILPYMGFFSFSKGIICILRKYPPLVVHTNFSSQVLQILPISKLFRVKRVIATEHCYPIVNTLRLHLLYQWIALFSNNVLAVSKRSRDSIRYGIFFRKKQIHTLYLGIKDFHYEKKEAMMHNGIKEGKVVFMNVAYHNPVKGVDVLLNAVHLLVYELNVKNFIVYQIGGGQTGKDTEDLYDMAKSLKIEDYVVWMGLQNNVPEILSAGDIYVQPSRSEGIPLSIMEASLASLPTVATKVGGIPEAARPNCNGILVTPDSPSELAEAMKDLIEDEDLRKDMGGKARRYAKEKFCLERQVELLIQKYYRIQ